MSESKLSLEARAMRGTQRTFEDRRKMWLSISNITAEQFDAHQAEQRERQVKVPQPGTMAPDFELDVLTRERKRTGERIRLSSLREKPVGLIFGSYT